MISRVKDSFKMLVGRLDVLSKHWIDIRSYKYTEKANFCRFPSPLPVVILSFPPKADPKYLLSKIENMTSSTDTPIIRRTM